MIDKTARVVHSSQPYTKMDHTTIENKALKDYISACAKGEGISELIHSKTSQLDEKDRINCWFTACCLGGHSKEAELLLQNCGRKVDLFTASLPALRYVIRTCNTVMLELLIKYGRQLRAYTNKRQLLCYMIRHNCCKTVRTLIFKHEGWFEWDSPDFETVKTICRYGTLSLIYSVLSYGLVFSRNEDSCEPEVVDVLFLNTCRRRDEILSCFLDHYADRLDSYTLLCGLRVCKPSMSSNIGTIVDTCLHNLNYSSLVIGLEYACHTCDHALIEKLVCYLKTMEGGSEMIESELRTRYEYGDIDTFRFVIKRWGYVMCHKLLTIMCDCSRSDLEIIRMLVESHGDQLVGVLPRALHRFCTIGDMDIAELLVDCIGDNISSIDCVRAFNSACAGNHCSIIKLLTDKYRSILCFYSHSDFSFRWQTVNAETIDLLKEIYGEEALVLYPASELVDAGLLRSYESD